MTDAVNQRCFSVWGLGCIRHRSLFLLFFLSSHNPMRVSARGDTDCRSVKPCLADCYQVVQTQPVFQTPPPSPWFWYNKLDDGGGLLNVGVFEPPDADVSWRRFYWILSPWRPQDMGPSSLSISTEQEPKVCPQSYRVVRMRVTRSDKCCRQIPEKLRINWCSFVMWNLLVNV